MNTTTFAVYCMGIHLCQDQLANNQSNWQLGSTLGGKL